MTTNYDFLKIIFFALILILSINCNDRMNQKNSDIFHHKLDSLEGFEVKAISSEITKIDGQSVLKLDGMIVLSEHNISDACIEVEILAQESCYPGIAFRIADDKNYELAYAVPHVSGQTDAIQYDPVFNGSNTWQLHNGEPYQKTAEVPTGKWFSLRIEITGDRAAVWVDNQPPLIVEHLAHSQISGSIGLWSYKPVCFRNLKVGAPKEINDLKGKSAEAPLAAILDWKLQDGKILKCEPNGILNLNRYMPPSNKAMKVSRDFHLSAPVKVEIGIGFSDTLKLFIDGEEIFQGENLFKGFKDIPSRGWVSPDYKNIKLQLNPGNHTIEAELRVKEAFGWGLLLTLKGQNLIMQSLE
jgi:hypothetical protein